MVEDILSLLPNDEKGVWYRSEEFESDMEDSSEEEEEEDLGVEEEDIHKMMVENPVRALTFAAPVPNL